MGREIRLRRMAQNTMEDKIRRTRQLRQSGGSTVVTIPPEFIEFTEFEQGDDVDLVADLDGDELVIRRAEK